MKTRSMSLVERLKDEAEWCARSGGNDGRAQLLREAHGRLVEAEAMLRTLADYQLEPVRDEINSFLRVTDRESEAHG